MRSSWGARTVRSSHEGARRRLGLGAAILVVGLGWAGSAPPALAAASARWNPGLEAPLPSDGVPLTTTVNSVSCPSAGHCSAVGSYYATTNNDYPLLLTETAGSWPQQGSALALPANADQSNQDGTLYSVSCASVGNCSAVGSYYTSGNQEGLLATEKAGKWQTGIEAALPTPTNGGVGTLAVNSVSCPSSGNCAAVGSYTDKSDHEVGLILNQVKGIWHTGINPVLPAGAVPTDTGFESVSCASPGNCSAVGFYQDKSGNEGGLAVNEVDGKWQKAIKVTLPAGAAVTNQEAELLSVSCPSPGDCSAGGLYSGAGTNSQGLVVSEVSGKWHPAVKVALPAGAASSDQFAQINAVSCRSVGNCSAVGQYNSASGNDTESLLVNELSGKWQRGLRAVLPANATTSGQSSNLRSVACPSAGNCTAVGDYLTKANAVEGLLLSETAGRWQAGRVAVLPNNHSPQPNVVLSSALEGGGPTVACPAPGSCTAVGDYVDTSNNTDGLLLTTAPARPTLSLSVPASGKAGRPIAPSSVVAQLAGGFAPVGRITFEVLGPRPTPLRFCRPNRTDLGAVRASGNRAYHPSAGFTPAKAGNYWWYAVYGGDASDLPATSKCGSAMPKTVVK